ncbi:MAG: hypothetical protein JWM74_147 [Myxococcaceae bacterium]|jgi:hypothetical protein|nr:hypothetical protein [Myxococcaceae bacterium]
MSPHRALACLAAASTFGALIACSSGTGTKFISSTSSPHERSDEASDSPNSDQTDDPPAAREGAQCLPCTTAYKCSGTIDDVAQQSQIFTLKRSDCATTDQRNNENVITFACGGTVAIPGRTVVGTWKDVGAGVLQICFGVLGRDQCLTCSPTTAQGQPDQTGGSRDAGSRDSARTD